MTLILWLASAAAYIAIWLAVWKAETIRALEHKAQKRVARFDGLKLHPSEYDSYPIITRAEREDALFNSAWLGLIWFIWIPVMLVRGHIHTHKWEAPTEKRVRLEREQAKAKAEAEKLAREYGL